jgi:transcription initiation factor IIE alpha subunit
MIVVDALRSELKRCDMTSRELSDMTGIPVTTVCKALRRMEDAYIDRWMDDSKTGRYIAVWSLDPNNPGDCPRPDA